MPFLSVLMIRTALVYFFAGGTFGSLLLAGKGSLLGGILWRYLPLHSEALLFGFLIQFIFGVAFWMFPRMASGPPRGNENLVWISFGLLNFGIVITFCGMTLGLGFAYIVGACLECGSILFFAMHAWPRVKAFGK